MVDMTQEAPDHRSSGCSTALRSAHWAVCTVERIRQQEAALELCWGW